MTRIIFIYLILLCSAGAYAQTSTTVSGTADIYTIMDITVTNLSGVVSFTTFNDYQNGQTINNAANVEVRANVNWTLGISAQSANFTAMSGGASTDMPCSVLGIRRNGTTTFLTMSTASQTLKTGTKGGATTSGNDFDVDTRITPGFTYNGGTYSIGVLYTLSQQ